MMDAYVYKLPKVDASFSIKGKYHVDNQISSCKVFKQYPVIDLSRNEYKTDVKTGEKRKKSGDSIDSSGIDQKRTCFDKALSKHYLVDNQISSCKVFKQYPIKDLSRTEYKTDVKTGEKRKRSGDSIDSSGIDHKRTSFDKALSNQTLEVCPHKWRLINAENLNLKYTRIFTKQTADFVFRKLEEEVKYFSGDQVKVKVFGKWHDIPRKQVSYGDSGLSYTFSGTCIPAVPWNECNIVMKLKELVESVTGHPFNFVLVNRYKDGMDHMGEHRDDEKDLVETAPIASLSIGQQRDFIFKHKDARGVKAPRKIDPVKIELEHGSLLLMEWPTNNFWYHSLPVRKRAQNARINLTFRQMVIKQ